MQNKDKVFIVKSSQLLIIINALCGCMKMRYMRSIIIINRTNTDLLFLLFIVNLHVYDLNSNIYINTDCRIIGAHALNM